MLHYRKKDSVNSFLVPGQILETLSPQKLQLGDKKRKRDSLLVISMDDLSEDEIIEK